MNKILLIPLVCVCVGCSSGQALLVSSSMADSLTTYSGISKGAHEVNPIYPNNAKGAAVGSLLLKLGVSAAAKRFGSKEVCKSIYKGSVAGSTIGATNNVIQQSVKGVSFSNSMGIGILAAVPMYKYSSRQARLYCN